VAETLRHPAWRCSECGDVLPNIEEKRLPRVCERCDSRLPFERLPAPPHIFVSRWQA